ncbi:hypothetical protein NE237_016429 [Protea cynaroides]|uniref:Reticulon domain-containing protein n=1 Tax=Protea cynaroides TaxID=273540 RepID=A0A9Q0K6T6_9MAGN|nr:hypothetical protein NE237_016429 [Protea cynaroides]
MYAGFRVAIVEVILWRRKNVTLGILFVALAAWVVFEGSGYTLLLLVSSVLLLLAIVFLWTKSAEILNRKIVVYDQHQLRIINVYNIKIIFLTHDNVWVRDPHNIWLPTSTHCLPYGNL